MQGRGRNSLLSPEDLKRIVGPGAYDQHGKGNVNVGDGGVAFLLASSGAIPGGAPLVSQQTVHIKHLCHASVTSALMRHRHQLCFALPGAGWHTPPAQYGVLNRIQLLAWHPCELG